jgi:hypothetical protein
LWNHRQQILGTGLCDSQTSVKSPLQALTISLPLCLLPLSLQPQREHRSSDILLLGLVGCCTGTTTSLTGSALRSLHGKKIASVSTSLRQ